MDKGHHRIWGLTIDGMRFTRTVDIIQAYTFRFTQICVRWLALGFLIWLLRQYKLILNLFPTGQQAFVTPFFEGDIVLDPGTRRSLGVASMMHRAKLHGRHAVKNAQRSRRVRAAVRPENQRWTDGVIPYTIDSDFGKKITGKK